MQVEIDTDTLIEALKEDDDFIDSLATALTLKMQEGIGDIVRESFDYHSDHFRMSWVRMMESELNELKNSTRSGACGHGQQVYDGLFHAIEQFFIYERERARVLLNGINNTLPTDDKEDEEAVAEAGNPRTYTVGRPIRAGSAIHPVVEVHTGVASAADTAVANDPLLERLIAEEEAIEAQRQQ